MKNIVTIIIVLLFAYSCSDVDLLKSFGPEDKIAPGSVSDVEWTAIPGGADISYKLPLDEDLSYVKVVYSVDGQERHLMSSQYNTEVRLEGLPNMDSRNISIYCVDKSDNISSPFVVEVTPQESPVIVMRNSLSHKMDFGGFKIKYENPSSSELTIQVSQYDELFDIMRFYDSKVFTQSSGEWHVINLPNEKIDFNIVIKDKFGNVSEPYAFVDVPWRELSLDKKMFQYVGEPRVFDKDDWFAWGGRPTHLWDGITGDWNFAQTGGDGQYPHYFCMDLGQTVPIGRILIQQRMGDSEIFAASCPKKFDVYGVEKLPVKVDRNNPLAGWTKLNDATFELVRPSGRQPGEPVTEEDRVAAKDGIMFTIDTEFPRPEIRYLKFVFTEGFSNNMTIVSEISLWAQWR